MVSVEQQQQKARDWAILQGISTSKPRKHTANMVEKQQQNTVFQRITMKPSKHVNNTVEHQQQRARDWAISQGITINQQRSRLVNKRNSKTTSMVQYLLDSWSCNITALFVALLVGFGLRCAFP